MIGTRGDRHHAPRRVYRPKRRNQAYNHAGNMAVGLLGWRFGFAAVFWLAAVFAVVTIAATDESLRLLDDYAELVAQYRG